MDQKPIVLAFAGPNGSGKSTVTRGFDIVGEYINADEIKKMRDCSDLEAAQIATQMREDAVLNRRNFTFETVLSSPRNVELLRKAKNVGYMVEVVFVLTADCEINVERVKNRVKNGGHDVPEDKIRSRYHKSLVNLAKLFKFADVVWVIDNSADKAKLLIHAKDSDVIMHSNDLWSSERLRKLISGTLE